MRTIRWGIIGVGDVTEVKSGPGFQKATYSQLVAVMRRNGDLARSYAERHGVPRWYDDAEALIKDGEVDAVYIATPPHVHKPYTLMCAEAGKPVLVEKPMALDFEECQEMLEACKAAGMPLWVAYYRRSLPRFAKIKKLLEEGTIGQVRTVSITFHKRLTIDAANRSKLPWRVLPEVSGGGLFVDLGSHTLDFLDYTLGPITSVRGQAVNRGGAYPAEDQVVGSFLFESGVVGTGNWCFTAFDECDETVITGSEGQLSFSTFGLEPIALTTLDDGPISFEVGQPQHVQQPLIQSIVNELNGVGACPSTGDSGARTTWVIDQLLKDYRKRL
jgi:predicted dehydrogenase